MTQERSYTTSATTLHVVMVGTIGIIEEEI
jgi:hypothetical protein